MAISLANFRAKLDTKLFGSTNEISRDVTVYSVSGSTTDSYGDVYETYDSGTSVRAVPYNKFTFQKDFLKWGELQDGESEMAFRYDTTITSGSVVVDANQTTTSYEVQDIEDFPYGNGNVAIVARLKEQL